MNEWERAARDVLSELQESHLHRHRREFAPLGATHVQWRDRRLINFASNNYLGLTHHPQVIAAIQQVLQQYGAGSGASALICGHTPVHEAAEQRIAQWKGTESSVLLPSGYQANHAAVQTLSVIAKRAGRNIRFLLDKLCHASLIDAVRQSSQPLRIFPHNGLEKLQRLLREAEGDEIQVVVTEAIFSMDGDASDLHGLNRLKQKHPFVLMLDEAHSSGVYGPGGRGLAVELGLATAVDVTMATLSKAVGCVGGVVCGSTTFCEAVVNVARAYIYSTNIPAHVAAGACESLAVMQREPGRQRRLRELARRVRQALHHETLEGPEADSPIIPVIMGDETAALEASEFLLGKGMLVPAVRPPSVPRGGSRLRITLCSEHTDQEIDCLIGAIKEWSGRPAVRPPAAARRTSSAPPE